MKQVNLPDSSYLRLAQALEEQPRFIFDFGGDVVGSDQYNGWIVAYDGETKEGLGYIQYSL